MGLPTIIFLTVLIIVMIPIVLYFMVLYLCIQDIIKGLSRLSGAFKKLAAKFKLYLGRVF